MDELVEYLRCNDPENIIAGEDDCNLLILGDGTDASTKIKMLLLIVGTNPSQRGRSMSCVKSTGMTPYSSNCLPLGKRWLRSQASRL